MSGTLSGDVSLTESCQQFPSCGQNYSTFLLSNPGVASIVCLDLENAVQIYPGITQMVKCSARILSSQVVSLPFQSVIHPEDSSL